MLRVLHIPSHLIYAATLTSSEFVPVRSPAGRPLRIGELATLGSWDFFDVLHVHTVELATEEEIEQVVRRTDREGKRLVFTVHDIVPNIESDDSAFERKTALLGRRATAVATLTKTAAEDLRHRFGPPETAVRVIPHGAALPLSMIGNGTVGEGVAVFGALRPNRDLVAVARAWRLLSEPRPPLRMLVRSLAEEDRRRYRISLAELENLDRAEPSFTISMTGELLAPDELSSWCRQSALLVLPYRRITHSGQLELARDIGLRALAPDVTTLREQRENDATSSTIWFPTTILEEPSYFAGYLKDALSLRLPARDGHRLCMYRTIERRQLLRCHYELYYGSSPERV